MKPRSRADDLRSTELLRLGKGEGLAWTIADATEGTQVFGATGSGKTSGSGYAIALAFLRNRFGGLVLTAKPEDRGLWEDYTREAGRSNDLIVVDLEGHHRFNFLDYEHQRGGRGRRLTQNLVSIFTTALEPDGAARSGSDPYWEHALRQLLTNAIDTVALSGRRITLGAILDAILTAPRGLAFFAPLLDKSLCAAMLRSAHRRELTPEDREDLGQCIDYWGHDFAGLAERTRSVVVSSFTSRATSLLRGPLKAVFCSDSDPTFRPEDSYRGKIILLDLPVKEFGDVGRFAQVLFKTVWQRATERRSDKEETTTAPDGSRKPNPHYNADFRPVFLWADESQHFVTAEDLYFQATARSSLAATVYLTQNISNYYAVMGGREPRAATDSLLGNLVTKIFHANGDPSTNEWAERLFGRTWGPRKGSSIGWEQHQGMTTNVQESFDPVVPAYSFTKLKKGGLPDRKTECILYLGGRLSQATGNTRIEHVFSQRESERP